MAGASACGVARRFPCARMPAPAPAALALLVLSGCASLVGARRDLDALAGGAGTAATTLAVAVAPTDGSGLRYARSEHRLLHPASILKLLTAATALHAGLLDTRVATRLLVDPERGALLLEGGGDPFLAAADLETLLAEAEARGVASPSRILVDASRFDPRPFGDGWMWDDEPAPYMPWISALTLNAGAFSVRVSLGASPDAVPAIALEPPGARHFELRTDVSAAPPGQLSTLSIRRDTLRDRRRIEIAGTLARGTTSTATFSIPEPDLFVGEVFATLADDARPETPRARVARLDPAERERFVEIARVERPMSEILKRMLKDSDNLAAESVLRIVGLAFDPTRPGSAETGLLAVHAYLASLGRDPARYRIADGSGLSLYNLVDVELLLAVLLDMARRPTHPAFRAMLPAAGIDGRLASRFTDDAAKGRLDAKTGTLAGCSGLAGYLDGRSGETYAFALLASHYVGPARPWRERIDAIASRLAEE